MTSRSERESSLPRVTIETLENRQLMAGTVWDLGLNANNLNSRNYPNVVQTLRAAGSTSVRLWYGFNSYYTEKVNPVANYVHAFKDEGFDVTLSVVPENGLHGSPVDTTRLFNFLVSIPGLVEDVDRWEVGNEPDFEHYWQGSLESYVGDFLIPAARVLHSVHEVVVSAGPSWNPQDVKTMVDAGMLPYVDYVGYHPYRYTLGNLVDCIAQVRQYAQGKPLVATEWNIRGYESDPNPNNWASALATIWPVIRDNFAISYYYAANVSGTRAGASGLVNTDGSPNDPFYSVFVSLRKTISRGGNTGGTGTGGTGSGGSGSGGSTSGNGSGTGGSGSNSGNSGSGSNTGGNTGSGGTGGSTGTNGSGGSGSGGSTGGTGGSGGSTGGSGSSGGNSGGSTGGNTSGGSTGSGTGGSTGSGTGGNTSGSGTGGSTGGNTSGGTSGGTNNSGGSATGGTGTGGTGAGSTGSGGTGTGGTGSGTGTGGSVSNSGSGGTTTPAVPRRPRPPRITGLNVIPTDGQASGVSLMGGQQVIDISTLGKNVNFVASTGGKVGSVQFSMGRSRMVDSTPTFTMYGEAAKDLQGIPLAPGTYTIRVRAFSDGVASGSASRYSTFSFTVIDGVAVRQAAARSQIAALRAAAIARHRLLMMAVG